MTRQAVKHKYIHRSDLHAKLKQSHQCYAPFCANSISHIMLPDLQGSKARATVLPAVRAPPNFQNEASYQITQHTLALPQTKDKGSHHHFKTTKVSLRSIAIVSNSRSRPALMSSSLSRAQKRAGYSCARRVQLTPWGSRPWSRIWGCLLKPQTPAADGQHFRIISSIFAIREESNLVAFRHLEPKPHMWRSV